MRQIAALLASHPRNDLEAIVLLAVGMLMLFVDLEHGWVVLVAYLVACAFVFQRWYARIQAIEKWPPDAKAESTADFPGT